MALRLGVPLKVRPRDLSINAWLLKALVQECPDRLPPPALLRQALCIYHEMVFSSAADSAWLLQEAFLLRVLLVKLRRLRRRAPKSRHPAVTMLKALLQPSSRAKACGQARERCSK